MHACMYDAVHSARLIFTLVAWPFLAFFEQALDIIQSVLQLLLLLVVHVIHTQLADLPDDLPVRLGMALVIINFSAEWISTVSSAGTRFTQSISAYVYLRRHQPVFCLVFELYERFRATAVYQCLASWKSGPSGESISVDVSQGSLAGMC